MNVSRFVARHQKLRTSAFLAVVLIVGACESNEPPRPTTPNLRVLTIEGDAFYNYDFTEETAANNRVDWPLTFIFHGFAEVDLVKDAYRGRGFYPSLGGEQKSFVNDGDMWRWDEDKGIKLTNCPPHGWFEHMRIYSDGSETRDQMWNANYGFWVLGTTHFDYDDGCDNPQFGYSETAEGWFVQNARTVWGANRVLEDWGYVYNPESIRTDIDRNGRPHVWESDGHATFINVP